ncbi:MAG: Uma2 family endonuclease [Planctomycetaceae bacterium]
MRHEYIDGFVYAMVGARNAHNLIASNVLVSMGLQLKGRPCRAFNSDTKVRVRMTSHVRFYYPDAMVVCHQNPQDQTFQDAPVLIVEVMSESTRRLDDGEKRDAYFTIPSLTHYVLLNQNAAAAIVYERQGDEFIRTLYTTPTDVNRSAG